MKLQNLLTVVGTAARTMVLVLTLVGPRTDIPAYAAELGNSPVIAQPQLQSQGWHLYGEGG